MPSFITRPFEIKSLSTDGTFEGYASTYQVDSVRDQILPGAFRHTLSHWQSRNTWPLLLWQHHVDQPIGKWTSMTEDARGLKATGTLLLDIPKAREAYTLIKAGALDGLSIGFRPTVARMCPQTRVRKIYQVDLVEVSLVTLPANDGARIQRIAASA